MGRIATIDSEQPIVSARLQGGRVSFVSATSLEVSGLAPDHFVGRRAWELVHPDDRSLITRFMAVDWTGEIDVAVRLQDEDDAWTWRRVRGTRQIDQSGQPGATITLQRITFP